MAKKNEVPTVQERHVAAIHAAYADAPSVRVGDAETEPETIGGLPVPTGSIGFPPPSPELDAARDAAAAAEKTLAEFETKAAAAFARREFEEIERLHSNRRRARLELHVAQQTALELEASQLTAHMEKLIADQEPYVAAMHTARDEARRAVTEADNLEALVAWWAAVIQRVNGALEKVEAKLATLATPPAAVFEE